LLLFYVHESSFTFSQQIDVKPAQMGKESHSNEIEETCDIEEDLELYKESFSE